MILPKKEALAMNKNINYQKINNALKTLNLSVFISLKELRSHYFYLAKANHPDKNGNITKMSEINEAYEILKTYMENYRFTFSEDEILKQLPQEEHARRFGF